MNKYIEEYWKNSDITDLSADQLRVRINVQYIYEHFEQHFVFLNNKLYKKITKTQNNV